jgi:hypothetical protein
LLEIVVAVGIVALPISIARWRKRIARRALDAIARALGGRRLDDGLMEGERNGRFFVLWRTAGPEVRIAIQAAIPTAYPLELAVWRERYEDMRAKNRGKLLDIELGHRGFDDTFVVEGAPAAVIKQLLDQPTRVYLIDNRSELEIATLGDARVIQLTVFANLSPEEAVAATDVLLRIVAAVPGAFAAVGDAAPTDVDQLVEDSPYRPVPDDRAEHDLLRAHTAEVAALRAQRKRRGQNH